MMFSVILKNKDEVTHEFWMQYSKLWLDVQFQSPFYSPSFIKLLFNRDREVKIICAFDKKDQLVFVFFLKLIKKNRLILLSNNHADHNPFIFSKKLSSNQKQIILTKLTSLFPKNYDLYLNNIPKWSNSLDLFVNSLKINKFYFIKIPAALSPSVKYVSCDSISKSLFFKKKFTKRRTNNYHNRLKKLQNYQFEIFNNDNLDLRKWIEDYCDNHEERWNLTDTPSRYSNTEERDLLHDKSNAWHNENQLVRFSIKVYDRRIASVICYKQNSDRLIYGLPSYSTEYDKLQPGTILVSEIGKWLGENNFSIFDFGLGSEKYKFRYSNDDQKLYRLYITQNPFSFFLLKGFLENIIRTNNILIQFWQKILNSKIRKLSHLLKLLSERLIVSLNLLKTNPKFHITRIYKTILFKKTVYFKINKSNIDFLKLHSKSNRYSSNIITPTLKMILNFINNNPSLNLKSRSVYIKRFYNKNIIPYAIIEDNKILQLSWVSFSVEKDVREKASFEEEAKVIKIFDCITDIDNRRKGLYKEMLSYIINTYFQSSEIIIYADDWNIPSINAILNVGFVKFGIKHIKNDNWNNS